MAANPAVGYFFAEFDLLNGAAVGAATEMPDIFDVLGIAVL